MSTKGITPRLADGLRSLAESQLQTQVSRSVASADGASSSEEFVPTAGA